MRKVIKLGVLSFVFFSYTGGLMLESMVHSYNAETKGSKLIVSSNSANVTSPSGWNPRVFIPPENVIEKDGQKVIPKVGIGSGGPNFLPREGVNPMIQGNRTEKSLPFSPSRGQVGLPPRGSDICPPEVVSRTGICPVQAFQSAQNGTLNGTFPGAGRVSGKDEDRDIKIQQEKGSFYDFYKPRDIKFSEPEVAEGVYFKIGPEKVYFVRMSGLDINRIVCPGEIQEVVYSEERGVKVTVSGRNVFVKFLINKTGQDFQISNVPVDMYIVCNGKVYSLVGIPARIPGVMVYLEDKEQELKRAVEKMQGKTFEDSILSVIRSIFAGKVPDGAEYVRTGRVIDLYAEIIIKEEGFYDILGSGYIARYFSLTNRSGKDLKIHERMFLKKEISVSPLAISVEKLFLRPGESTSMIVVEKKRGRISNN